MKLVQQEISWLEKQTIIQFSGLYAKIFDRRMIQNEIQAFQRTVY